VRWAGRSKRAAVWRNPDSADAARAPPAESRRSRGPWCCGLRVLTGSVGIGAAAERIAARARTPRVFDLPQRGGLIPPSAPSCQEIYFSDLPETLPHTRLGSWRIDGGARCADLLGQGVLGKDRD